MESTADVLYAHEVFAAVAEKPAKFDKIFMPGDGSSVGRFWESVRDTEWFRNHEGRGEILNAPNMFIPFALWGDEAPLKKCGPRQVRVVLWSSIFCGLPSKEAKLLGAVGDTADVCERVVAQEQYKALAWSLNVCFEGKWPYTDHNGRRYTEKDGVRFRRRGTLLHPQGMRIALAGVCGDLKFFKEEFRLFPNYSTSPEICFMCEGSVMATDNYAYKPSLCAGSFVHLRPAVEHSSPSKLAAIKGYSNHIFREDYLHVDLQGVRPFINGSCFQMCLEASIFGIPLAAGTWRERMAPQLRTASLQLRQFCKRNNLQCYLVPFKTCTLSLKNLDSTPYLKAKAHAEAVISLWLESLMPHLTSVNHSDEAMMASMTITGFSETWRICKSVKSRCSIFMSEGETRRLEQARERSLHGYHWLWTNSKATGHHRWHVIPKCHYVDHMHRRSIERTICMSTWWTFSEEDWIGRGAKLAGMTHGASMNRRPLQRWVVGYFCDF